MLKLEFRPNAESVRPLRCEPFERLLHELFQDRNKIGDPRPAGAAEEGPTAGSSDLPVGLSRFQCCIHPWMRTVIEVADNNV